MTKNYVFLTFNRVFIFIAIFISPAIVKCQYDQNYSATEIKGQIDALGQVASVLYIAAHPDDENTRLISYYSNVKHYRTSYLSLTRGDGGQNLIGPELRELLGVIRTQELLAARRIDGGNQYFTRANDFGYSKNAEETLRIWDKQKILADVVWAIRKTRPDIIINRFNAHSSGETHGHHTSSAILSLKAFELAGDSTAFPKQLKYVDTWQPKRIFFNTSWWFYGSKEKFKKADKSRMVTVDVGAYIPSMGESNTEIAARSRSMHKSQGFGLEGERGQHPEYLEFLKGKPLTGPDPMSGIPTSLNRLDPSGRLLAAYMELKRNFSVVNPEESITNTLNFIAVLSGLEDSYWKGKKMQEAKLILKNLAGIFVMASTSQPAYTPGDSVAVELEIISRNYEDVSVENIVFNGSDMLSGTYNLELNKDWIDTLVIKIPNDEKYTSPYWLRHDWTINMYTVENQQLIGLPENKPALFIQVQVKIAGKALSYDFPVIYQSPDQVKGEIRQSLAIVPEITMNIDRSTIIFSTDEPQVVSVNVKAWQDGIEGVLKIDVPDGWEVIGLPGKLTFAEAGQEKRIAFKLIPPEEASQGYLKASFKTDKEDYKKRMDMIDYNHIPKQYILRPSEVKVVKLDLETRGQLIGYIEGAGDKIPQALEQMGYEVKFLGKNEILTDNLTHYDAIVTGIRAYSSNELMPIYQPHLMKYVKNGGTLIVQYTTTRGLLMDQIGPYPFTLSHERVTDENAEVHFLQPDSPILNYPNNITQEDFKGWIQERGLYFATKWDKRYIPILGAHDKGEPERKGGMLLAHYGKGYYVYTGYSWFRELPAGVPGAFRIFANLVSLGN